VLSMLHSSSRNVLVPETLPQTVSPNSQSGLGLPQNTTREANLGLGLRNAAYPARTIRNPSALQQQNLAALRDVSIPADGLSHSLRTGRSTDFAGSDMPYNLEQGIYSSNPNPLSQQGYERIASASSHLPHRPLSASRSNAFPYNSLYSSPSGGSLANSALQPSPQRLPHGLANLGGRPPHDPSQLSGGHLMNQMAHSSIQRQQQSLGMSNELAGVHGYGHVQSQMAPLHHSGGTFNPSVTGLSQHALAEERGSYGMGHLSQNDILRSQFQQNQSQHLSQASRGSVPQNPHMQHMQYQTGARSGYSSQSSSNNDLMSVLMRGGLGPNRE